MPVTASILITEVGPSDGLQSIRRIMPIQFKLHWIDAPGASGNVVTDDLVFMFVAMGVPTGVDLDALMVARDASKAGRPGEPVYGMTPEAGLTKGCTCADGRLPRNEQFAHAAASATQ